MRIQNEEYGKPRREGGGSAPAAALQEGKGKKHMSLFLLFLVFAAAGFLNGFSGAGGGMVLGIFLPPLFREEESNQAFAYMALAVFLFSLSSAIVYFFTGRITLDQAFSPFLPAVIGGVIGGYLLEKINPILLKCLFAGLLIYAGVRFVWA